MDRQEVSRKGRVFWVLALESACSGLGFKAQGLGVGVCGLL